ncbi:MAG: PAS domain-containing protein [Pseudolabrys sp.]
MHFPAARPDVVRAINQRWLLKFWMRHLGGGRAPLWQSIDAADLSRISDNLSFLDVTANREDVRFKIRFHGAVMSQVYGSPDCRGRYLDEIIPPQRHRTGLAPYRQALECSHPIYTIHEVTDRNGRVIHFERLLLPFSQDGATVDRILASFEFVCDDGAFDGDNLLQLQNMPPALRLSATIEPSGVA